MKIILAWSFSLLLIASCVTAPVSKTPEHAAWGGKMHELSQLLSTLFPYILSKEEFHNEKNFSEIDKSVRRLSELAHNINRKSKKESPDSDPAVGFLATKFDSEINRAYSALQTGHREYSRHVLAVATNHCINCHTRSDMGPQFGSLNLNFNYEKLNPFVRAETYVATRQFQKAIQEYEKLTVDQKLIARYPFEIERSMKNALSIQVRVFNDVNGASRLVDSFLKNSELPLFLSKQAKVWQEDLNLWKKEVIIRRWSKQSYTKEIETLIARAEQFGANDSALISFLRASAVGHEFLSKYKTDPLKPEVLFKMGVCYESLQDLGYWSMSEDYYIQCIREKPHSVLAVKCYKNLEASIFLGYTGSMGTQVPQDVQEQLKTLKELAL